MKKISILVFCCNLNLNTYIVLYCVVLYCLFIVSGLFKSSRLIGLRNVKAFMCP